MGDSWEEERNAMHRDVRRRYNWEQNFIPIAEWEAQREELDAAVEEPVAEWERDTRRQAREIGTRRMEATRAYFEPKRKRITQIREDMADLAAIPRTAVEQQADEYEAEMFPAWNDRRRFRRGMEDAYDAERAEIFQREQLAGGDQDLLRVLEERDADREGWYADHGEGEPATRVTTQYRGWRPGYLKKQSRGRYRYYKKY